MIIATWNVNSIRARIDRVSDWLARRQPDIVCLQETKVEDKNFPYPAMEDLGYHVAHCGQPSYNGVAILAREPLKDVRIGMDDGDADDQARVITATVRGVRVISAYFPNGGELGSEKYAFKLRWMGRLRQYLDRECKRDEPLALCGDFNVAPEDRDVHDPAAWKDTVLFSDEIRVALQSIQAFGLVDAYRLTSEEAGKYSWWDYRQLAFPKNMGLRIDHVYVTPSLAARVTGAEIDREERKGKQPSDHVPVMVTFADH
jgi:exodeoxyribonuclease III